MHMVVSRWRAGLLALGLARAAAGAPGPGIPKAAYADTSLFKPLSSFHSPARTSWGNGVMLDGYFLVGFDVDEDSSGFQVWDFSNPRAPRMAMQKYDAETKRLREIQNFSFAYGYGRTLAAIPSHAGLEIWDFTDILKPARYGAVALAQGGGKGIYNGVISTAWQPPYIYCGAMDGGLFVVDASDPRNPKRVKNIPNSAVNGRLAGRAFALGDLLVLTTMAPLNEECVITTFDISDPADPQIQKRYACGSHEGHYTAFLNGRNVYGMGTDGRLHSYEVSGFDVYKKSQDSVNVGRGGYGQFQDGYVHAGMSTWYVKYDVRGFLPKPSGRFLVNGDNDWVMAMGNLAFVGDDDGPASAAALVPHQAAPDTVGPRLNWSVPAAGAVRVPTTARIGLSFSDNLDFAGLDARAVTVRRQGGEPVAGKFSLLEALLNFTPDQPLAPDAVYEVRIAAGGLRDWGGAAVGRDTAFTFTTGTAAGLRPPGRDYRLLPGGAFRPGEGPLDLLGRTLPPVTRKVRVAPGLYLIPAAR